MVRRRQAKTHQHNNVRGQFKACAKPTIPRIAEKQERGPKFVTNAVSDYICFLARNVPTFSVSPAAFPAARILATEPHV